MSACTCRQIRNEISTAMPMFCGGQLYDGTCRNEAQLNRKWYIQYGGLWTSIIVISTSRRHTWYINEIPTHVFGIQLSSGSRKNTTRKKRNRLFQDGSLQTGNTRISVRRHDGKTIPMVRHLFSVGNIFGVRGCHLEFPASGLVDQHHNQYHWITEPPKT